MHQLLFRIFKESGMFYASKKKTFILILMTASLNGIAQNPIVHFGIDHNETNAIDYVDASSPSEGYILTGVDLPNNVGGYNNVGPFYTIPRIMLRNVEPILIDRWQKTYVEDDEINFINNGCANLSYSFKALDVKKTQDNGFIICGSVISNPDVGGCGGGATFNEGFLLKTDQDGNAVWYQRYTDGNGFNSMELRSVVEDPATGNFIAVGVIGGYNALKMETDPLGNIAFGEYRPNSELNHIAPFDHSFYGRLYGFVGSCIPFGSQQTWKDLFVGFRGANNTFHFMIPDQYLWSPTYPDEILGAGIHDAYDGQHVVILGKYNSANNAYHTASPVLWKFDPVTHLSPFYKSYRYATPPFGDMCSLIGNSFKMKKENQDICISGFSANHSSSSGPLTGAMYLETDNSGNVRRQTTYTPGLAYSSSSITLTDQDLPAFTGSVYDGTISPQLTFIVSNIHDQDCPEDNEIEVTDLDPAFYDTYTFYLGIINTPKIIHTFDLPDQKSHQCGNFKPSAVNKTTTKSSNLIVFPNPSKGGFKVSYNLTKNKNASVKVVDILGNLVFEKLLESNQTGTIDISMPIHFASGTYIILLYNDGMVVKKEKVMLQR